MTTKNLLSKLSKFKNKKKYPLESIFLFGSYARGEQTAKSDVDLFVTFSGTVTLFDFLDLKKDLEDYLGLKVDLTTQNALKKEIRKQILDEAVQAA